MSPRSTERLLPHSDEAERAVLGALLLDNSLLDGLDLRAEDFYRPAHEAVLRAVRSLRSSGTEADLVTVGEALRLRENPSRLRSPDGQREGFAYLASMIDGIPRSTSIASYAAIVSEKARRRRLANALGKAMTATMDDTDDAELDQYLADLADIASRRGTSLPAEDLADILSRSIPETPWAVEGLIAEGDVGTLSGPGGLGKSWLLSSLLLSLATRRDVFGCDFYPVRRPYRVALLDLESRPWEIDQRLHRLARGMGLDADAIRGQVQIVRRRVRLDRAEDLERLMMSLRTWGTEFLGVDSFRRCFGGDENSSAAISALFSDALDRIRIELGCGLVISDHIRKPTGEPELDDPAVAQRGSTDKRNMGDWHIGVEARQERIGVIPTKSRHGRLGDPFQIEITGLRQDDPEDGPVQIRFAGALDRASDKVQDAIVAMLAEVGKSGLLRGEIIGRSPYSPRANTEALRALKDKKKVTVQKEGKQARYTLIEKERAQREQTSALQVESSK